jgi:tripartite-type tricarboxylate transporter receptor subunit TctC
MKGLIAGGKLRPLAVTAPKSFGYLPGVPTAAQAGVPGYAVTGWNALAAPAGTPPEVVAVLNKHINTVIAQPDFKAKLLELGTLAYAGKPEELARQLDADVAKWRDVIEKAGIQKQ